MVYLHKQVSMIKKPLDFTPYKQLLKESENQAILVPCAPNTIKILQQQYTIEWVKYLNLTKLVSSANKLDITTSNM